jgi:thioredoxin 1
VKTTIASADDTTFESEVLRSEIPVLVEFSTEWCPPCRALAPLVEALSREYEGRLKVVAVDGDIAQQTATAFRVRGFPTLVVIKDGREVARQLGSIPKSSLTRLVAPFV